MLRLSRISEDRIRTKPRLPSRMPATLKIKPNRATENDVQNRIFTQVVWQVRPSSKVPDNSCMTKKTASPQLMMTLKSEIGLLTSTKNLVLDRLS